MRSGKPVNGVEVRFGRRMHYQPVKAPWASAVTGYARLHSAVTSRRPGAEGRRRWIGGLGAKPECPLESRANRVRVLEGGRTKVESPPCTRLRSGRSCPPSARNGIVVNVSSINCPGRSRERSRHVNESIKLTKLPSALNLPPGSNAASSGRPQLLVRDCVI
jgi:hypothetical protein